MTDPGPIKPRRRSGPVKPCPDCGKLIPRQCAGHVDRDDGTRHRCHRSALLGSTTCAGRGSHGGQAAQVKRKAAERVTAAQTLAVLERWSPNGNRTAADVPSALAAIIAEIRHFGDFMGDRLAEFTEAEWHYSHPDRDKIRAEIALYERALDRAGRILVDVGRLGIEAAIAGQAERLEKSRARRIVEAVEVALDYVDLSIEQRKRVSGGLGRMLLYRGGEVQDGEADG